MSPVELLAWYVALHNLGVETSDFNSALSLFAVDAVFEFRAPLIDSFEGKEAIKQAFAHHPPSTAIILSNVEENSYVATADYADTVDPFTKLGTITLESDGEKIKRIIIG